MNFDETFSKFIQLAIFIVVLLFDACVGTSVSQLVSQLLVIVVICVKRNDFPHIIDLLVVTV